MDEAERLGDRIAVLARGRIVADGPAQTLAGRDSDPCTIAFTLPAGIAVDELPADLGAAGINGTRRVEIATHAPLGELETLARWARARGLALADLTVERPRLEDVYLQLTD
jgi:ABC-2 type transport system ATP-binding protein